MATSKIAPDVGGQESQAFFAALLAACRSKCKCEVCVILRGVADSLQDQFMPRSAVTVEQPGKARS